MITLLGSLLGFFGAAFPDILKIFRDKSDKEHELKILMLQIDQQKQGYTQRLDEIRTSADISESIELYKTYKTDIRWVDALNGSVRPVLAYAFFLLYASAKYLQFTLIPEGSMQMLWVLWQAEDQAIFAGIISFYFGQRAMSKLRGGK
jgi:hypothetical protein